MTGSPGLIVWLGVMACIWACIAIDNLARWHRPQDYWSAGVQSLLWVVLIANTIAWFTRRDVVLRPGVPMSRTGKAVAIIGALIVAAGAVAPGFLIADRDGRTPASSRRYVGQLAAD